MELNELSPENISAYVRGCEEVALTLDDVVSGVLDKGKIPTILIPSRGAVPIYLIAATMLGELNSSHLLLDKARTRYYPDHIFEYLSDGRIRQNGAITPEAEVILYPFTADVTSEGKQEVLARQLRYSATEAFLDLVSGGRTSLDLNWYFFLMSKMHSDAYRDHDLSPAAIVDSLKNIQPSQDRQIILIDTVISGRASSQILDAFNELGHPVIPVLAVDENKGQTRFRKELKSEIREKMSWWEYLDIDQERAFLKFPLITEDKGAALLGVSAINFINFNQAGFFKQNDNCFSSEFLPQSCVWALPPKSDVPQRTSARDKFIGSFHRFLDKCLPTEDGGVSDAEWQVLQHEIKNLVSGYGQIDPKEVQSLAKVEKGTSAKESSSHIISVKLNDHQAREWIKEFISSFRVV